LNECVRVKQCVEDLLGAGADDSKSGIRSRHSPTMSDVRLVLERRDLQGAKLHDLRHFYASGLNAASAASEYVPSW